MSSEAQPRSRTTGPTDPEEITAAIPRQTGPWSPPRGVPAPPRPHGPGAVWSAAPAHGWSAPAGLGPFGAPGHGPVGVGGPAPGPTRPGTRRGWIVLAVVVAIATLALVGSVASLHRTMTVSGTVTIYGMSGVVSPGSGCTGSLATGLPVTIYGASGELVGTTSLSGYGTARNTWGTYSGYADSCEYAFTIEDVAATHDFYRVKTGSSVGDGVGFSREQLESSGAHVTRR